MRRISHVCRRGSYRDVELGFGDENGAKHAMNLKILLPFESFLEETKVHFISLVTNAGSLGILPHRLDCVGTLVPGIMTYKNDLEKEFYIAHNEGVFVKSASNVVIAVRNAVSGNEIEKLHELVEREFSKTDANEKSLSATLKKLESGVVRKLAEYQHE